MMHRRFHVDCWSPHNYRPPPPPPQKLRTVIFRVAHRSKICDSFSPGRASCFGVWWCVLYCIILRESDSLCAYIVYALVEVSFGNRSQITAFL